jgi:hypothetical protein
LGEPDGSHVGEGGVTILKKSMEIFVTIFKDLRRMLASLPTMIDGAEQFFLSFIEPEGFFEALHFSELTHIVSIFRSTPYRGGSIGSSFRGCLFFYVSALFGIIMIS